MPELDHWEHSPHERVTCETSQEASYVACRRAAERRPGELIVYDAYNRVVHHRLNDGREGRRRAPLKADDLVPSRPEARLRGPDWAQTEPALSDPLLAAGSLHSLRAAASVATALRTRAPNTADREQPGR